VRELERLQGSFDIITVCFALALLEELGEAVKHWAGYLRRGGRMVVDVHIRISTLSLKVFDPIGEEFGVHVLGKRAWIKGPESLRDVMEAAGLETGVLTTEVFGDIPARTEVGRGEWGVDQGGSVSDRVVGSMKGWDELVGERRCLRGGGQN
jgi:hypothetical protein